jgi:predicted small lipoprotein YifL
MLKRAFGIVCSLMVAVALISTTTGCGDKKKPAADKDKAAEK